MAEQLLDGKRCYHPGHSIQVGFVNSFRVLRTDPAFTVKDATSIFDADTLAKIKITIRSIPMNAMEIQEIKRFGRIVVHNHADLHGNATRTRGQGFRSRR